MHSCSDAINDPKLTWNIKGTGEGFKLKITLVVCCGDFQKNTMLVLGLPNTTNRYFHSSYLSSFLITIFSPIG